jgi:hypothetical protein
MHTNDEYADVHFVMDYAIGVQQQLFEDARTIPKSASI